METLAILLIGLGWVLKPHDPQLTPGVLKPLTLYQVCHTIWHKDHRYVSEGMKIQVLHRYGYAWSTPDQLKQLKMLGEFDHWEPRELGGDDKVENIWLQPWAEAHRKDLVENELHKRVCGVSKSGITISLNEAQELMNNWPVALGEGR